MSAHARVRAARSVKKEARRARAGFTMLELLVASGILAMMAVMIFTAFEHTGHMRDRLGHRQERDHVARIAIAKLSRDLRSAFLSAHVNTALTVRTSLSGFVARHETHGDRLDLTTFTHRRLMRHAHEGDACEVGYRVEARRDSADIYDLLRRESPRIDDDVQRGGTVDVLVPDVANLVLTYYEPATEQWKDSWDTTQASGEVGRLPPRVRIVLTLNERDRGRVTERVYRTETPLMMLDQLRFGLPIDYR